jgi:hypothetical protein
MTDDCTPRRSKTKFFPIHIPSTPAILECINEGDRAAKTCGTHHVHLGTYEFHPADDKPD